MRVLTFFVFRTFSNYKCHYILSDLVKLRSMNGIEMVQSIKSERIRSVVRKRSSIFPSPSTSPFLTTQPLLISSVLDYFKSSDDSVVPSSHKQLATLGQRVELSKWEGFCGDLPPSQRAIYSHWRGCVDGMSFHLQRVFPTKHSKHE